jgi:hypothetical protein
MTEPADRDGQVPPTQYAKGGLVSGPVADLRVERVGVCANGHCLYRFMDGTPEHVISAAEVKAGDASQILCPETVAVQP